MNWDLLAAACIAAFPPTLVAFLGYMQSRQTHLAVNSRMDELLRIAKRESAAQATLDEKAAEHTRKGEAAVIAAKIEVVKGHP